MQDEILVINDNIRVTGAENVFNVWNNVLKDYRVVCVHPEEKSFCEVISQNGWASITYETESHLLVKVVAIFRALKITNAKCVLINNGGTPGSPVNILSILIAFLLGKKVIYVFNNMPVSTKWYKKLFIKFCLLRTNKIVSASEKALKTLLVYYGIEGSRGVSIKNYSPPVQSRKKTFKNDLKVLRLVSFGALVPRKGYLELIDALQSNLISNSYTLTIYGEGPLKVELLNRINSTNNIFLMPFTTDKSVMSNYDIFILNSICCEDMPYAIIEAMSCKLPIISTNVAGIPELVENRWNGWIVEPKDSLALIGALKDALHNRNELGRLGDNSFSTYSKNHSLGTIAQQWRQLLLDV